MRIEYSTKDDCLNQIMIEDVTMYIQLPNQILIFTSDGLHTTIPEGMLEDFSVYDLET